MRGPQGAPPQAATDKGTGPAASPAASTPSTLGIHEHS